MKPTTTAIKNWWNAKNELFTLVCSTERGESFTNGDVVLAHFALAVIFVIIGFAGGIEGGTL